MLYSIQKPEKPNKLPLYYEFNHFKSNKSRKNNSFYADFFTSSTVLIHCLQKYLQFFKLLNLRILE